MGGLTIQLIKFFKWLEDLHSIALLTLMSLNHVLQLPLLLILILQEFSFIRCIAFRRKLIALGSSSSQHDLMVYARLLERRRLLSKLEFFSLLFLCFLGHAVLQQGSCSLLSHMSLFSSSFFTSAVLLSLYSSRWCNLDCKMFCELNILVPLGAFLC